MGPTHPLGKHPRLLLWCDWSGCRVGSLSLSLSLSGDSLPWMGSLTLVSNFPFLISSFFSKIKSIIIPSSKNHGWTLSLSLIIKENIANILKTRHLYILFMSEFLKYSLIRYHPSDGGYFPFPPTLHLSSTDLIR